MTQRSIILKEIHKYTYSYHNPVIYIQNCIKEQQYSESKKCHQDNIK